MRQVLDDDDFYSERGPFRFVERCAPGKLAAKYPEPIMKTIKDLAAKNVTSLSRFRHSFDDLTP
jgi:hypothetical protein